VLPPPPLLLLLLLLSPLCRLLASSCQDVQEHAAAALMNMARDIIYGIPVAIAAAGGIPALVRWEC
jgi:hypothetical protein